MNKLNLPSDGFPRTTRHRGGVPQLPHGPPPQMLREAINHLKTLPLDAAVRADAFESLAAQIETVSGGAWKATRGRGTDGSNIFLGRQGEGLVVSPDGHLYRGAIAHGIDIMPNGLSPNYQAMIPLD
jgi:hypothetical protein